MAIHPASPFTLRPSDVGNEPDRYPSTATPAAPERYADVFSAGFSYDFP